MGERAERASWINQSERWLIPLEDFGEGEEEKIDGRQRKGQLWSDGDGGSQISVLRCGTS